MQYIVHSIKIQSHSRWVCFRHKQMHSSEFPYLMILSNQTANGLLHWDLFLSSVQAKEALFLKVLLYLSRAPWAPNNIFCFNSWLLYWATNHLFVLLLITTQKKSELWEIVKLYFCAFEIDRIDSCLNYNIASTFHYLFSRFNFWRSVFSAISAILSLLLWYRNCITLSTTASIIFFIESLDVTQNISQVSCSRCDVNETILSSYLFVVRRPFIVNSA